jgi:hypothetical protein
MKEYVESYIRVCILYCTNKPSNKNKGVYHLLHVPTQHWERILMGFVVGLQTMQKGHDYLLVVADSINKMFILMPCKNIIKG